MRPPALRWTSPQAIWKEARPGAASIDQAFRRTPPGGMLRMPDNAVHTDDTVTMDCRVNKLRPEVERGGQALRPAACDKEVASVGKDGCAGETGRTQQQTVTMILAGKDRSSDSDAPAANSPTAWSDSAALGHGSAWGV